MNDETFIAPYCRLPLTNTRRAYVSSHDTDVSRTFAEHAPIRVCPLYGDDYDLVQQHDWLSSPGGFR